MSNKVKFILNTSVEYFDAVTPTQPRDDDLAAITEFLENDELTVIAAVHNKSDGKIQFHHRIPNDEVCLLFYKIPQFGGNGNGNGNGGGGGALGKLAHRTGGATTTASGGNQQQPLGILTLEGGLVKSIYNSVSRVFSPQAEARHTEYSPELSGLLENLHVSLGSSLGLPQSGISSVKDEIKYWKHKLNQKSSSRIDREMAQMFIGVLESIDKQMSFIDSGNSGSSIEEFLDTSHNNLDELWRLPYNFPQSRMADILDIIGNRLLEVCVEQLCAEDIWNLSSYHINNLMSQCNDTIDSWMQLCDSLTRLFWPNYVQHPWVGEPHTHKRGQLFKERLAEIRNIKSLYKQISTLLNEEEIRSMFSASSPFRTINIYDTTTLGQTKWNRALQQFEQLLQPIDERIASALKSQLHNHLSNPRQVIFIFSKYETLIQRPTVLELLTIEREQFLQSLHILLQDLRKAMTDTNMEPDTGHLSVICNECRWLKVVQYQIQEVEKVSHLISGREGYDKINKAVQEIKEETESLLRTNFEIWCGQCSTAVRSGELKLREDQPVVKFEKEGRQLMRVTFNPKLVTFCQDVREFENLGYNVPMELLAAANHASKFMSYARRLQQIATFHNTIGDRMIPCQRPIMLQNAVELSKLVQSETVAWNDEESVQRYVNMLQAAVSKLSADNTLLVGYHEQAKRTVIKLMNTDLFLQSQIWKDEMRHLRELVASLERQNFTNLDAFKLHWDHQLYKVLEYQYIIGLVDMNNKLPDIHIDIIFRQRQLCYRPPEEEIRERYFTQLRRFIERPSSFRGLSEKSAELFRSMVEINRHHFGPLFEKAQELFEKLERFKNLWTPWVSLGCVDVEELCGIHMNTAADWDRNFKACKNFSQKIAKLQNSEESIDCFVINILPLRSDIEFISRRYWESLSNSLRASILGDVSEIQEFLQSSLQFLNNVAIDEASITESGMKYEKIMSELPKISETLTLVREKDTCLAGWCKERVSALDGILMQWEKLQPLIENHAVILQRQVNLIKDQAHTQIQNLQNEAEKFLLRWESMIAELEANEDTTLELFKDRQEHWQQIQTKKSQLLEECGKFNMEFPAEILQPFTEIETKMQSQSKQWELYDGYLSELNTVMAEDWAIYRRRPYVLSEFISKWEGSVHSSIDLPSKRIRRSVERLQQVLPVLQQLQSDALNERHWAKIFMLLQKAEAKPMHNILLSDILKDSNALQLAANEITAIVKQAASEQIVRQALTELDQWSVTANLKLITHRDSSASEITLIKDYQEILNKIGDNQSLLQSAKNSAAFDAFSDQAELWESRLNMLDTFLTSLSQSQRRWVYLEPVFGAGTLKNEEALFRRVDKDFRYIMREIKADPRVISLTKINNIATIINSLETQLMRCQNNLMSYIMEKRNSFPRFYFLGDDDLLEILGQAAKDAEVIQKHIRKLFPGCHSLGITQNSQGDRILYIIQAMHSAEGDVLKLKRPVEMQGSIEIWLNNLVTSMQETIKEQIIECHKATTKSTSSSSPSSCTYDEVTLRKYPIQVLATARSIHFTKQAEKSISSMSLAKLLKSLNDEIVQFTTLKNQATSDNLLQLKLRYLLFDMVHYVTIVEQLQRQNVMHVSDWDWLQQLKFYLSDGVDGLVTIRIVYAQFEYSYEFLGNPNKLVSTSLTQKCYLILTQAMHMGLGGNPFGPAGTGKTECVKALGAMLGRLVLVFNCDENVDTESMGLILTGLARCGAWGCFDEFNRLQEATLSAISMLIQPIQSALKDKNDTVQIADRTFKLNHHCGIFVTLNPAGAEYGGRQKLPGNIQALFRPIVMQQPEPHEISRVMLFVEGFQQAAEIGDRIVDLFELCAKMLSTQRHYDWGLRELKTILLGCGEGLRARFHNDKLSPGSSNSFGSGGDNDEMPIVVQCLRASTMSKLALHDVPRFEMLLQSVFPEVDNTIQHSTVLQHALAVSFVPLGLCANELQIEKALQLHEQLAKRMGVVIVGPPGCGKSTVIALLRQALGGGGAGTSIIRCHTISPKSMQRVQLLGRLDPDTRQWMDGVLTATAVTVNAEPSHVHSWIICDGSIDPEWIEALNSVLDDNKLLTLPSGWRIQFGNNVNFIFETDDVRHASPATISRMGIVNMSNEDFPHAEITHALLEKEEFGDLLNSYIDDYFLPTINWIQKEGISTPIFSKTAMQRALFLHMSNIQSKDHFCIALCKALFSFVPNERHNELANIIFERANIYIANPNRAELTYFNNERSAIEFFETDNSYYSTTTDDNNMEQLVQTAQIKSYLAILHTFLEAAVNMPFLIVGPSGSAKTLIIQQAVSEHTGYELVTINCSTQLTPAYIVHCLKQNCLTVSSLRGREYKPKQVRVILYLKNLDLCYLDAWGASEIVEFLLQLVQRCGFYADNLEWINVSGLQISGSISTTTTAIAAVTRASCDLSNSNQNKKNKISITVQSGSVYIFERYIAEDNSLGAAVCYHRYTASASTNASWHKIAPRFLAINQFLHVSYPTDVDMQNIVQSRMEPLMAKFKSPPNVQYVAEALMDFFRKLQETFTPATQGCMHYQFSPKILMKLLNGLQYYPDNAFNEAFTCEINSIFKDRLATAEDVEMFENIFKQTMRKFYGKEKIFFIPKTAKHNSVLQAFSHDDWMEEVQKHITICNTEIYIIDEPVTKELLDYTAKITRLLTRSESNLILLGQPGSRHLDALYIAITLQQAKIFTLQGGKNYNLSDFYNDLKSAMQTAALENQCTCLLIDQSWISFLPDIMKPIEAILEGSEILDLFGEDLESIASSLKHDAQLEGYQESIGSYFLKRTKQNLHLIIVFDSTSKRVNEYFSTYPALHRNMDFIYARPMSRETYTMLPKKLIEMLSDDVSNNVKTRVPVSSYMTDALEEIMPRQAPKRYAQFIKSYYFIYTNFSKDLEKRLEKLHLGVDKLAAAHAVVDSLKSSAVKQEDALADKRKLANDALEMISSTMRNANEQKSNMLELKKKAQISSEKLKERQKEIQLELSEVAPILEEASAAVGQIKSEALSEIRSLRAPPEAIRDILEGVLRLMGIRDTSWNSMKTFLAKRGVKEDIRSLDPARISPENCEGVEKLLVAKADSFELKNAKRASAAAAPLATWVKASVRYSKVIQSIKPLEREQNELQRNLDVAEGEMQSLMTGLDDVDNRVKQLSAKLNAYTQEAAVLELKLEEARNTLSSAEVLVEKLSSEFQTWSMQLDEYKQTHKTLDIKSLIISLAINYFSHLSLERRVLHLNRIISELELPISFDLRRSLLTEQEQIIWESMGLARDAQIIENAAITRQILNLPFGTHPIPLILDPTQTALNWLEEYLRSKGRAFEIISQNHERLAYSLELAVRFGKILLVNDCQDLRPPIMQLAASRIFVRFNKKQIEVGSKLVDMHEHFQLVLFTKTNKLTIETETRTHLTCIPFTITAVGLTDQLMSKVIVLKNPALEQKRIDLLKNEGVLLKQRIELEDKLLEELSTAQGDILKNEKLLQTLNEVKESSSFIDKSLKESALVKETLLADYTQLRELCFKASQFYMELSRTYDISALIFINLCLRALDSFDVRNSNSEQKVYMELVRSTFQYLSRSTPRSSYLTLAMFVSKNAYPERIKLGEWELFVTNFMSSVEPGTPSTANSGGQTNFPEWVTKEAAAKLYALFAHAPELEEQLQLQKDFKWKNFIVDQGTAEWPGEIRSSFHRVLIAQIFRPDLIATQLRQTSTEILGISPDSMVQPTVEQLADESTSDKPILVITQTENDPATEIKTVALKKVGLEHYNELSIGKGMERKAMDAIKNAAEVGKWICIKNVHLVPTWLIELDRELGAMKRAEGFRLWLVCESTQGFNEAVIYKFIKVLYEFPAGIKNKVRRMLQNFAAADAKVQHKDAKLLKIRVVLFILNAVLQERRRFMPQGWSKYYEFGDADLKAALEVLHWLDAMTTSGKCDWKIMQRLCESFAFGGRINNTKDLHVLQRYLEDFFSTDAMSNRWTPLNFKVMIPTTTGMQDYFAALAKFPDVDEPETFKLSKHSNISREIEFIKTVIKELRNAYYKSDNENESPGQQRLKPIDNKLEKQIKPILSLWRKLAGKSTLQQTAKDVSESVEETNPWKVFVVSELKIASSCHQEVHATLSQVHNWLKETQASNMAAMDQDLLQKLADNQVPTSWRKLWPGPQTAVDYMKGLVLRSNAAEKRYRQQLHLEFTDEIDLVNVFNCETFIAALKLINSKKLNKSTKNLSLISTTTTSSTGTTASISVKLQPLKVDGAVFVHGRLAISTTTDSRGQEDKSPEYEITFVEQQINSGDVGGNRNLNHRTSSLSLPLYSNVGRERLICHLDVATSETADAVLLSGAALIVADF